MSEQSIQLFTYPPTVKLLQSFLKPGAVLLQVNNLKKAWRIYVYLRVTYGDGISWGDQNYLSPFKLNSKKCSDGWFKFSDWLQEINIQTKFPLSGDKCQLLQQISIDELLGVNEQEREQWCKDFQKIYKVTDNQIEKLLAFCPFATQVGNSNERTKLYRLDFQNDLAPDWLIPEKHNGKPTGKYRIIKSWSHLIPKKEEESEFETEYFFDENIADFVQRFTKNSNKRLIFATEYVSSFEVSHDQLLAQSKNTKYQKILKSIEKNWESCSEVKPFKLTYQKFTDFQPEITIIYPVTFVYIKRAPYLYAINEPQSDWEDYQWGGYRLDRILEIEILNWDDEQIPKQLLQLKQKEELPSPEEVEDSLYADTLGYAFWKISKIMLVRFSRNHYRKYIQDSSRQEIFQEINQNNYPNILKKYRNKLTQEETLIIQESLSKLNSQNYIFCLAKFYKGDIDVFLRLLTWGKNVKVIFPQDLREQIVTEINAMVNLYQES